MTKSYFMFDTAITTTRTLHIPSPSTGQNPQRHLPKKHIANTKEHLSRQENHQQSPSPPQPNTASKSQLLAGLNMVAGKRVSPQHTARIRACIEDTTNPRSNAEIANLIGVSARTIERLRLNFELFDAPYPPPRGKLDGQ
jgi:hypothetical protein